MLQHKCSSFWWVYLLIFCRSFHALWTLPIFMWTIGADFSSALHERWNDLFHHIIKMQDLHPDKNNNNLIPVTNTWIKTKLRCRIAESTTQRINTLNLQAQQWYQYKVFKQNTYNLLTLLIFPQTGQTEKSDGSAPHQNQYPPLQHS